MALAAIDYTDKERIEKIAEILAEGALESLNFEKHLSFYMKIWERTAETAVILIGDVAFKLLSQPIPSIEDKLNNNGNTTTENSPLRALVKLNPRNHA